MSAALKAARISWASFSLRFVLPRLWADRNASLSGFGLDWIEGVRKANRDICLSPICSLEHFAKDTSKLSTNFELGSYVAAKAKSRSDLVCFPLLMKTKAVPLKKKKNTRNGKRHVLSRFRVGDRL